MPCRKAVALLVSWLNFRLWELSKFVVWALSLGSSARIRSKVGDEGIRATSNKC